MPVRQLRQRKCRHCEKLFRPHPAVGNRQKFCIAAACQKARKAANNREFFKRNPDYHRGALAVARTREWRQKNPGYWRRRCPQARSLDLSPDALQVELHPKLAVNEPVVTQQRIDALQAELISQRSIFQGFAAHLTGCALQAELVLMMGQWHDKGAAIGATQGCSERPRSPLKTGGNDDETKLCVAGRSTAARTEAFQLDRPSTDS